MAHTLYELDVRLREIEPPIWRTIEVPGAASLEAVHYAIQVAMGWTNSHLHQFTIGRTRYGMTDVDGADELELENERAVRLQDVVAQGATFLYEYDFGDGWEHAVTVQKVTTQAKAPRPRCTAGARACPPEDCGGFGGYENLVEALRDPHHEEHAASVTWSNGFDAERFTLPKTGLDLQKPMAELEALANDEAPGDQGIAGPLGLPQALVEAVLALEPMQRASLGALVAGSLAEELVETLEVAGKLVAELRKQRKPAPHGRKRTRS